MRLVKEKANIEGGQALILFTLMLCALFLIVMSVVDVGFFLHNRENAQQTADAAALAGAQDLPGSTSQAQADALAYVTKNGLDTANTTISFTCTSNVSAICLTGDGRYDTIIVTQKAPSPTYFGGVLSILGFSNCWVQGCTASATAGACRGACGPIGTGPADIMTVMDHSYSMSDANITNAKDAITSMFTNFDYTYQRVGLAVTPPVTPSNNCDAIDHWADTKVWMPAGLTSTFQTAPHVLKSSSPPVADVSCMDRTSWSSPGELTDYPLCSCHTDVGSPIQAATDELSANGRANVKWGMIIVTDGAANVAPTITTTTSQTTVTAGNTGFLNCTTSSPTGPVTVNSGDNNGYETSPGGCAANGTFASDVSSGNNSAQIVCPDTTGSSGSSPTNNGGSGANGKDKAIFGNYGISLPASPTVTGITVKIDGKISSTSGTHMYCVQLSRDGGLTYSAATSQSITSTSVQAYTFGNSADLWGLSNWTATQLNNTNFRVRLTNVANDTSRTFYIDDIQVKVDYTTSVTTTTTTTTFNGTRGPCEWAATQATAAKALGIEVFVIGFGVPATDQCNDYAELSTSPYYNTYAPAFLQSLATDASHFYNQPKTSDLEPIFNAIGSQLTGGSKLIQ